MVKYDFFYGTLLHIHFNMDSHKKAVLLNVYYIAFVFMLLWHHFIMVRKSWRYSALTHCVAGVNGPSITFE